MNHFKPVFILLSFLTLFILPTAGFSQAQISRLDGDIKLKRGDKVSDLKANFALNWGDVVSTADTNGFLRFTLDGVLYALKGPFRVNLAQDKKKNPSLALLFGSIRARIPKGKKIPLVIRTKAASAGVRGTDFYMSYGKALGETEVVCFESAINFRANDGKSQAVIQAGQWGGLGGRFGNKIAKPLILPKDLLATIAQGVPLK